MNILTVKSDWEEVYSVEDVSDVLDDVHKMWGGAKYYQTFGGGPEGGYFVTPESGFLGVKALFKVRRGWGQPWKIDPIKNTTLEYEPEDEMKGKTARCRRIEEIDIKSTRKIIDDHALWGNAIEIVKCLRDGLDPKVDASYKDLCLGIILNHFKVLDDYLGLLPVDSCPTYKGELQEMYDLKNEEDSED